MRWLCALGVIAAVGCGVPPNVSPVSFGVPDGMVLGRDVVVASPQVRAEVVTFAVADRRATALVVVPVSPGRFSATIRFAKYPAPWPPTDQGVGVTVLVPLDDLPMEAAARAMVASFEEVDPARIKVVPQ